MDIIKNGLSELEAGDEKGIDQYFVDFHNLRNIGQLPRHNPFPSI